MSAPQRDADEHRRGVSGRSVVAAMFAFSILVVGAMWVYLELYTRPFRDLQYAIAAEFPDSRPRVIGGRHKSDARNPAMLRIIARVEFDPHADEDRALRRAAQLAELADAHHDLSGYDVLEIHLYQRVPERETRQWSTSRPIAEWFDDAP